MQLSYRRLATVVAAGVAAIAGMSAARADEPESLAEIGARLGRETEEAYAASPCSVISRDYFARFVRDPGATPRSGEVAIDSGWTVVVPERPSPTLERMTEYLRDFMRRRMDVELKIATGGAGRPERAIELDEAAPGAGLAAESFRILAKRDRITVSKASRASVRRYSSN